MSSLQNRVALQRDKVMDQSADIRRRGDRVQKRLGSIGLDLGSVEWKNGRITLQVSPGMGIVFLIAGIAGLFLLKFRARS